MKTITWKGVEYTEIKPNGNKLFLLDEAGYSVLEAISALKMAGVDHKPLKKEWLNILKQYKALEKEVKHGKA